MSDVCYDSHHEPIVLSKPTLDLLLRQPKPSDLIALYTFYYYTAKWQKTNTPKCTTAFVINGLKWTEKRVQSAKQTLLKLGLVEDYQTRDELQRVTGHYIRVKFIWTREKAQQAMGAVDSHHPVDFPGGGKSQGVENRGGNALSSITLNALSSITPDIEKPEEPVEKNPPKSRRTLPTVPEEEPAPNKSSKPSAADRVKNFLPLAEQLADIVKSTKRISTPPNRLRQWADEIRKLCELCKVNPARVKRALDWYAENVGGEFIPVIESGASLRDKFTRLEAAIERSGGAATKCPAQEKPTGTGSFAGHDDSEDRKRSNMKSAVERAEEYERRTGKKAPWIYDPSKNCDE